MIDNIILFLQCILKMLSIWIPCGIASIITILFTIKVVNNLNKMFDN